MSTTSRINVVISQYRQQLLHHEHHAELVLNAAYVQTLGAIQPQLNKLYAEIAAAQQSGQKISPSWLYEKKRLETLRQLITSQVNHYGALSKMQVEQLQATGLQLGLQAGHHQLQATVPDGIHYSFGVPSPQAIANIVGATQAGSPLSDLFNGFGEEAAQNASSVLIRGIVLGNNPRTLARDMAQALGISRNRALVISRNEMLRTYKSANMETFRANSDTVSQWRWSASKSVRTCAMCIAMDGSLHDLSEDFDSHIQCGCAPMPVTKDWDEILGPLGIDTSNIPNVSDDYQSGSDWLDEQNEITQKQILGNKYDGWVNGDFDLSDLVGVSHNADWGTSRYEKPLKELVH